jgi:superfamily II DNA or RNA helicase
VSSASQSAPPATFLDSERLTAAGPKAFTRTVERLLWHLGFDDVRNIDGPGDEGGDILAARDGFRWVFQSKWKKSGLVDEKAVREVDAAKAFYGADRAVVVTNRAFGRKAGERRQKLRGVGVKIDFWRDETLERFATEIIPEYVPARYEPRPYQRRAVDAATAELASSGAALVIMATGLGKTVVAGEVIDWWIRERGGDVLVVGHLRELVRQLEKALWRHVPKRISTQTLSGDERPPGLVGLTCATVQSALAMVEDGWRPAFVVIDEAHHVAEEGLLQRLLDALSDVPKLALTATPWRGDGYDIASRFGPPVFTMGIADGMAAGFLAEVDYRLFVDTVDWADVAAESRQGLTVKELNRRLFLPQRDEAVVEVLRETWQETLNPRGIVFCRTINHAEEMARLLREAGWRRASCINTRQSRRDRDLLMSEFRDGRVPIVTAVDIFNEGVDVPDVSILCFMRVTHSRRIFVQQLGRGLRLTPHKQAVTVLDFVSDIRRVAATINLQRELDRLSEDEIERLRLPRPFLTFSEPEVGTLLQEWIADAAALEDADDAVRLQFPDLPFA